MKELRTKAEARISNKNIKRGRHPVVALFAQRSLPSLPCCHDQVGYYRHQLDLICHVCRAHRNSGATLDTGGRPTLTHDNHDLIGFSIIGDCAQLTYATVHGHTLLGNVYWCMLA